MLREAMSAVLCTVQCDELRAVLCAARSATLCAVLWAVRTVCNEIQL